jgi:hypothetical protein
MSNLATKAEAIRNSQGTNTAVKVTLVNEIVPFYAEEGATPQHLMSDEVNDYFVGRAWGAWYVHHKLMTAQEVQPLFIAKNYHRIELKANSSEFSGELARVSAMATKERENAKAKDKAEGVIYAKGLGKAKSALSALRDEMPVVSQEADEFIMALKSDLPLIIAAYERALANQQEKTPINA